MLIDPGTNLDNVVRCPPHFVQFPRIRLREEAKTHPIPSQFPKLQILENGFFLREQELVILAGSHKHSIKHPIPRQIYLCIVAVVDHNPSRSDSVSIEIQEFWAFEKSAAVAKVNKHEVFVSSKELLFGGQIVVVFNDVVEIENLFADFETGD